MLNLISLFETFVKTEHNSYTYGKIKVVFTANTRGFGTSLESGQPAHPCCQTRIYSVCCSNTYSDIDVSKFYNGLFEN